MQNYSLTIAQNARGEFETLCVKFIGESGAEVSLAFDCRALSDITSGAWRYREFGPYTDCPVIDATGAQHTMRGGAPVSTLAAALVDII